MTFSTLRHGCPAVKMNTQTASTSSFHTGSGWVPTAIRCEGESDGGLDRGSCYRLRWREGPRPGEPERELNSGLEGAGAGGEESGEELGCITRNYSRAVQVDCPTLRVVKRATDLDDLADFLLGDGYLTAWCDTKT